jgi:uncharacterized protein with NRDE domain
MSCCAATELCLILLAWQTDPHWRLVLAANRDERHDRASAPVDWWPGQAGLFAGRDLVAGGTWLGITRAGRFAALTNYRDLRRTAHAGASRGMLVRDFLLGRQHPLEHLAAIDAQRQQWPPFNLLVGDTDTLVCLSTEARSASPRLQVLGAGIHGISNHLLNTPWPKVRLGREAMRTVLASDSACPDEALFQVLASRSVAADPELPDTGLPLERERATSAAMIVDPVYGTRCASVLLVDHQGRWRMQERSFAPNGQLTGIRHGHSGEATAPPA